jgi:diadenosine tetraphosphatase ApaH/serine/threonine PP2A family protein phosphatase
MAERLGARGGDVVAFGHTHKPWHRMVDGIHFLNTGSVGRPKDGDWRAGFVLLDFGVGGPGREGGSGNAAAPTPSGDPVEVEFIRVPYDLERARAGILASTLPDEFADQLAGGGQAA